MSKYNYFFESAESNVTPLGKRMIHFQNKRFISYIKTFVTPSLSETSLLEVGPGKGHFAAFCLQHNIQYMSIEESPVGVESLKKRNIPVMEGSAPPISGDTTYDVIFLNQVVEHMPHLDDVTSLMESIYDHLNPGGIVIIGCPDILTHKEHFYSDYTHTYPTSLVRLRRLLKDFSLEPVRETYYTFFFQGYFLTRLVTICVQLLQKTGLAHVLFRKKSEKIISSLLPSICIVGKKGTAESGAQEP